MQDIPGIQDILTPGPYEPGSEHLERLDQAARNCREVALCGLQGIGRLLWLAAQDEMEEIDPQMLGNVGRLIMHLGEYIVALDEVMEHARYAATTGRPANVG